MTGPTTRLLERIRAGDEGAQAELYEGLYERLRALAAGRIRHEPEALTLTPTALVHEAYLALAGHEQAWADRAHALAVASRAMRHILVDHARRKTAQKRGDGAAHVSVDDIRSRLAAPGQPFDLDGGAAALLDLDTALTRLSERDERLGRVVECRIFGGLTKQETAAAIGISEATVDRDWARARAYLHVGLSDG